MTRPPPTPGRAAREAAALRQNLLKRKDQARRREEAQQADQEKCNDTPPDKAGAPNDTETESP
jgi:hypothetical protein